MAFFEITPPTQFAGGLVAINYFAIDFADPGGANVNITLDTVQNQHIDNPITDNGNLHVGDATVPTTPGTYITHMKFVWPDTTIIIFPFTIIVTP